MVSTAMLCVASACTGRRTATDVMSVMAPSVTALSERAAIRGSMGKPSVAPMPLTFRNHTDHVVQVEVCVLVSLQSLSVSEYLSASASSSVSLTVSVSACACACACACAFASGLLTVCFLLSVLVRCSMLESLLVVLSLPPTASCMPRAPCSTSPTWSLS
jgi:hypothetical protein